MKTKERNKRTGEVRYRYHCDSCQLLRINGVVCHETGCPDAWRDHARECRECGVDFQPREREQVHCSKRCAHH